MGIKGRNKRPRQEIEKGEKGRNKEEREGIFVQEGEKTTSR